MHLFWRCLMVAFGAVAELFSSAIAFAQNPTEKFAPSDPEMNAAIAEARRNLPRFFEHFRTRQADRYSVKVAIAIPRTDNYEHIWMQLDELDNNIVSGRLSNDPENLLGLRFNSPYRTKTTMISDWSYWRGAVRYGNYTTRVILKRIPPHEAEPIRKMLSQEP